MLRILYAGSPEAAVQPLIDIVKSGKHKVVGVLTNPPSIKKRNKQATPTPVAEAVHIINETVTEKIAILEPEKLDDEICEKVKSLNPDILVCFAYGKIFREKFMSLFSKGGINLHPSLLPLYRGCVPVPAAILACDAETGISIQKIAPKMDSGDLLFQKKIALSGKETSESLLKYVGECGGQFFLEVLDQIESNTQVAVPQDDAKATYCSMLRKEDGLIDWNDSAKHIDAKIRAFCPWPGSFTVVNGLTLYIHQAEIYTATESVEKKTPGAVLFNDKKAGIVIQTGNGFIAVKSLQWQTKKILDWKSFLNGSKDFIGTICGQ